MEQQSSLSSSASSSDASSSSTGSLYTSSSSAADKQPGISTAKEATTKEEPAAAASVKPPTTAAVTVKPPPTAGNLPSVVAVKPSSSQQQNIVGKSPTLKQQQQQQQKKISPIASAATMPPPNTVADQSMTTPPATKRSSLADDTREGSYSKKKKVAVVEITEKKTQPPAVDVNKSGRLLWSDKEEISLLKAYYGSVQKGKNHNEILDSVLEEFPKCCTRKQFREKLRLLKKKHEAAREKLVNGGQELVLKTPHEKEMYEIWEKIWVNGFNMSPNEWAEHDMQETDLETKVIDGSCEPDHHMGSKNNYGAMAGRVEDDDMMNVTRTEDSPANARHHVAQVVLNGSDGGRRHEREPIIETEEIKILVSPMKLMQEGLSIAERSEDAMLQQGLREIARLRKEHQMEITIRQMQLALQAIKNEK